MDLALIYNNSHTGHPICFADAAYRDDVIDQRSKYGHTLLIRNASVTLASKKKRIIFISTIEAEYIAIYIAIYQASKSIVWATGWIDRFNFGHVSNLPIQPLTNNKGTLNQIKNHEYESQTKYIDIQYHYIWEAVADGYMKA